MTVPLREGPPPSATPNMIFWPIGIAWPGVDSNSTCGCEHHSQPQAKPSRCEQLQRCCSTARSGILRPSTCAQPRSLPPASTLFTSAAAGKDLLSGPAASAV